MSWCQMRPTATPRVYACSRPGCGQRTPPTSQPPERILFQCRGASAETAPPAAGDDGSCIHRGVEMERIMIPTGCCGGHVTSLPLFACELYRLCVLTPHERAAALAACSTCAERVPHPR